MALVRKVDRKINDNTHSICSECGHTDYKHIDGSYEQYYCGKCGKVIDGTFYSYCGNCGEVVEGAD